MKPKLSANHRRIFSNIVLRILPPLLTILAFIRSFLLSSGDSPVVLPLESVTLMLIVFAVFGLSSIYEEMSAILRIASVLLLTSIPGIGATVGGWIARRFRVIGGLLLITPFVIDIVLAASLYSPIGAIMDCVMIALILLALRWEGQAKANQKRN